jgi:hypothetical protein
VADLKLIGYDRPINCPDAGQIPDPDVAPSLRVLSIPAESSPSICWVCKFLTVSLDMSTTHGAREKETPLIVQAQIVELVARERRRKRRGQGE